MKMVDRYVNYYKCIEDDDSVDVIVFDKQQKKLELLRNMDEMVLGSEDINGNYFVDVELPCFIFELIASSIEGTSYKYKKAKRLTVFKFCSNLKGKVLDLVIECKNKVYFTDFSGYRVKDSYNDSTILIDYAIMEIIISKLNSLGYKNTKII